MEKNMPWQRSAFMRGGTVASAIYNSIQSTWFGAWQKYAGDVRSVEDWQPIETHDVLKHGCHVIGCSENRGVGEYFLHDDGWTIAAFNGQVIRESPTHWQPPRNRQRARDMSESVERRIG